MATGDLTTLANVKAWFAPPLTATGDDALLTRLLRHERWHPPR